MQTELYRIHVPWPGGLAIALRPRGGDWLNEDIASWQGAGFQTVLSTLTPQEEEDLELTNENAAVEALGLKFRSFPIPDRDVPQSHDAVSVAISGLEHDLRSGKNVLIHCRQGIGRSGLIAGCLLIRSGLAVDEALRILRAVRGVPVPETEEQTRWLRRYFAICLA
jgi:protein-tyrosine phosphatase